MNYTILEWILIGILALTVLLVGIVLFREVFRAALRYRLERKSRACRQLIASYQKKQFQDINKLLFFLRDSYEPQVVEHVLREFVSADETSLRKNLREIYQFFQFTQQYVKDLKAVRWRTRAEAAFMLGQIGDPIAVPHLVERMKDPDEDEQNVKMACAQALGLIRNVEAIPHLIDALEDVNQWSSVKVAELLSWFGKDALPYLQEALQSERGVNQRIWAAQIMGVIGDPSTVPILTQRLRDRDSNVRIASVDALGRMKSPLAVHAIIDLLLRDPVSEVRAQAALALGQIADDRALKPLINALNDSEYWTRVRAVEALEVLGGDHVSELERLVFFDPRDEVRRRAAQALERLGVVEERVPLLLKDQTPAGRDAKRLLLELARLGAVQQIQGYLKDNNLKLRYRVCEVLGESRNPDLVGALLEASKDDSWAVRIKALSYLARDSSEEAIQALEEALVAADSIQRPMVMEALEQLNFAQLQRFYPHLQRLSTDENIETRLKAIELLAQFPSKETQSALLSGLQDPVAEVRLATLESLSLQTDTSLTPFLTQVLDDPDHRVRMKACEVLGRLGDTRAVSGLINALEGADSASRKVIADALSSFGLDVFYERLDELMGTDSLDIKIGICWVLGETGDTRGVRLLSFFLQDTHPPVRAAAIGSLGRIPTPESAKVVATALTDVNKRVRASAINALLRIHDSQPDYLQKLSLLLADPDTFVRGRAAIALGSLDHGSEYEEALMGAYHKERQEATKRSLLIGLGLITSEPAFQFVLPHFYQKETRSALFEALEKESPVLKQRFLTNLNLEHLEETDDARQITTRYMQDLQQSQDTKRREAAINALSVLSHEEALPYLLESLQSDPEESLRSKSAAALANLGRNWPGLKQQVQEGLRLAFSDPIPSVCEAALKALQGIADESIGEEVFSLLVSQSLNIQKAAGRLLLQIYKSQPYGLLDLLAGSDNQELNTTGLLLLSQVDAPSVTRYLTGMLQAKDRQLRVSAVRALSGHIRHDTAKQALHAARQDPVSEVRRWAIRVLSTQLDEGLIEQLGVHITDPAPAVRIALLSVLEQSKGALALQSILQLASDPDEATRHRAMMALLHIGSPQAVRTFLTQFKELPSSAQGPLLKYLKEKDALSIQRQRLRADLDPQRRQGALMILGLLEHQHYLPAFQEALKDPSAEVRRDALRLLLPATKDGSISAAEVLQQLTSDPDREIQSMLQLL